MPLVRAYSHALDATRLANWNNVTSACMGSAVPTAKTATPFHYNVRGRACTRSSVREEKEEVIWLNSSYREIRFDLAT